MIENPEFNEGLIGWSTFGNAVIEHRNESNGNNFVVAGRRNHFHDSVSQELYLEDNKLYTFSGIIYVIQNSFNVQHVYIGHLLLILWVGK